MFVSFHFRLAVRVHDRRGGGAKLADALTELGGVHDAGAVDALGDLVDVAADAAQLHDDLSRFEARRLLYRRTVQDPAAEFLAGTVRPLRLLGKYRKLLRSKAEEHTFLSFCVHKSPFKIGVLGADGP